jgi:hypothetical protein
MRCCLISVASVSQHVGVMAQRERTPAIVTESFEDVDGPLGGGQVFRRPPLDEERHPRKLEPRALGHGDLTRSPRDALGCLERRTAW